MRPGLFRPTLLTVLTSSLLWSAAHSQAASILEQGNSNSIDNDWDPASQPGSPVSPRAVHDTSFLPAQIGGIVAAYGVSLVLVAITLLSLAKKRREHLEAEEEEEDADYVFEEHYEEIAPQKFQDYLFDRQSSVSNLPHLSIPNSIYSHGATPYIQHSPASPVHSVPGVDPSVDQTVVAADKAMAQQQLEDMYRHVMDHEDAKQKGVAYEAPYASTPSQRVSTVSEKSSGMFSRKGKNKPSSLNLSAAKEDKSQSKASALFSGLLSPKKKNSVKGVSISSPIMTPMSGTFPRHESQEMNAIPPRHYAPAPPPPIPTDQTAFGAINTRASVAPMTPAISPESIQTIDERIGLSIDRARHSRSTLQAPSEMDPGSAVSEHSQVPLVGLPLSPKPGSRFPSLPSSPKPGSTFQRSNPPSAVRANGTLPLRAYEEASGAPSIVSQTTKQTVFERKTPLLSPGGAKTPFTANAVPYSPYQPFTPCVPVTPSLVTREDRKRMRKMVPKTPTLAMVKSSDEIW
ncbi:hypothetical protein PT974_03559 [Cladobotryum mycophilum]|uniref:Uncharacterized protein n=1 Tax=Cladobotryum mycophilum TaxID=491253 RepID=A0ABR0SSR7_9HYPO